MKLIAHYLFVLPLLAFNTTCAQSVLNVKSDLNGNQISVVEVCVGDSAMIDLEFFKQNGSFKSFVSSDSNIYLIVDDNIFR